MSLIKRGRPRVFPVRDTATARAIRLMRCRLDLGQIEFSQILLGRYTAVISRWESGRTIPTPVNLLRLLKIAKTPEERGPILQELKASGVDGLFADVREMTQLLIDAQPYISASQGNPPSSSPDSIAPDQEASNV